MWVASSRAGGKVAKSRVMTCIELSWEAGSAPASQTWACLADVVSQPVSVKNSPLLTPGQITAGLEAQPACLQACKFIWWESHALNAGRDFAAQAVYIHCTYVTLHISAPCPERA